MVETHRPAIGARGHVVNLMKEIVVKMLRTHVLVVVGMLAVGSPASSQVIVDVASADAAAVGGGIILQGHSGEPRTVANGFALATTSTLRAASFFTLECCNNLWSGDLFYSFFTANGTRPGNTPIAQGTATSYLDTVIYSDAATNVIRRIDFNLYTPIVLDAGSYFFALAASRDPGAGTLAWRSVQGSGTSASTVDPNYEAWGLHAGEAAFQLHGSPFDIPTTTVPEPVTMLLLGSGLVGIAAVARRRRAVPGGSV